MRFTIPQFVDLEPKIIGPITPRQFIIIMFAGLFIFIAYKIFDFTVFAILTFVFIIPVFGAFAFLKINGRPFHYFILGFVQNLRSPHLRIWHKEEILEKKLVVKKEIITTKPIEIKQPLSSKKLSEISLRVDTGGKYEE